MVLNRGKMKRKRKEDASSLILDYSPKRTKVHAQRKFAQGSNVNSPVMTPVKELERQDGETVMPEPVELLPIRRPNTEDFLTFLCFRGTPILPPSLNFFNTASIVDTNGQVHEIKSESSPKNGPIDTCAITKTGCGSSERPFVAFGVRKRADPIVISRQMDRKRRHALALQALRRKYQEQRMAKIRAVTISKLSEKVTNKVLVRTNTVKTETITKKTNVLHKTKVVATKHVKVTTQTVKTLRPPTVKPKMCLRSFRGRFVQRELQSRKNAVAEAKKQQLKPIKKVVGASAAAAVRQNKARGAKKQPKQQQQQEVVTTATKSESSGDDDADEDDDDEEEEEDDDDVPLLKTTPKAKVAPKVAKKTGSVGPKKPSEVNFRITRSNKFPNTKMTSRRQQIKQRMILTANPNTIVKRRTLRSHTTASQKPLDKSPEVSRFKSPTTRKDQGKLRKESPRPPPPPPPPDKKTSKDVPLKRESAGAKAGTSTTTKKETTKTEIMKRVLNKTIETSKNMVAKMPKPVVALRKTTINVIEHLKKKELERIKLDVRKAPPSSFASSSKAEDGKVKKAKHHKEATATPKAAGSTPKHKDATPKLKDGAASKPKEGGARPREGGPKVKDVKSKEVPKENVKKVEEPKEEEPRTSRPSRKTKEAAAIYMEILSHKLVNESRIDDDNVSIDSFPELPNAKKTEQRENELKAQAQDSKDKDQKKKNPQAAANVQQKDAAAPPKKKKTEDGPISSNSSKKEETKKGDQDSRALRSGDRRPTIEDRQAKSVESKKSKGFEDDKAKLKEKAKADEEKKAKAVEEEQEKKAKAEELARIEQERKAKLEEEETRAKVEAERIAKAEEVKKAKAEEDRRVKAEEEERRVKTEDERRMKAEEDRRVKAEEERRMKAEEEERRMKAEEEMRVKAEEEKKAKAEEAKKAKAEEVKKAIAEEVRRVKAEEVRRIKAEELRRAKVEEVRKAKADEVRKAKAEEVRKAKAEEVNRAKVEEEKRVKAEEEKRMKAEEEKQVKAEEEKKAKAEEEAKAQKEENKKTNEAVKLQVAEVDQNEEDENQNEDVRQTRSSNDLQIEARPVTMVEIRPKITTSEPQTSGRRTADEPELKPKKEKLDDKQQRKLSVKAMEKKQTEENQSKKDKAAVVGGSGGGGGDVVKSSEQKAKTKSIASCSKQEEQQKAKKTDSIASKKVVDKVPSKSDCDLDRGTGDRGEETNKTATTSLVKPDEKQTSGCGGGEASAEEAVQKVDNSAVGIGEAETVKKPTNTKRSKLDDKRQTRVSSNTVVNDSDSDESFHVDVIVPRRKQATRSKTVRSYASDFDDDSNDSPKTDEIIEEIKKALKKDAAAAAAASASKVNPTTTRPIDDNGKPKLKKKLTKTRTTAAPTIRNKQNDNFSDSDEEPLSKLKTVEAKPKRECAKRPQNYLPMFSSSEEDDAEIFYRVEETKAEAAAAAAATAKEKKQQLMVKAIVTPTNETIWDLSCKDIGRRFGKGKVNMSNEQIEQWIKDSAMAGFSSNKSLDNDDMLLTDKIPTDTSLVAGSAIDTQTLKKSLLLSSPDETMMATGHVVKTDKDMVMAAGGKNQTFVAAGSIERKIFRKEKLCVPPSANAFSANNESSVYAFEEPHDDCVMKTPFRRPTRRPSSTATSKSEDGDKPEETKGQFRKPSLLRQDSTKSARDATDGDEPAEDKPGPSTLMEPPINTPQKPSTKDARGGHHHHNKARSDRLSEASEDFKYKIPSSPSASSSSSAKLSGANKRQNPKQVKVRAAAAAAEALTPVKLAEFPCFGQGQLVEAPTFHPTDKEFQDPIEYIEKIRVRAEQFGICRIIPPATFKPECKVTDDMRFTAYNQYVHKMLHRWGPNFKELMAIRKYLSTQNISLTQPPWIGGMEIDLPRLYQTVQMLGGLKEVIEKKKWSKVSDVMKIPKSAQDRVTKLDDIYCKYLLPYDTLSPAEREKLFDEVETDWAKRESKSLLKAQQNVEESDNEEDSEDDNEAEECIVKGRNMALNAFYRIARNTMSMWFRTPEPSAQEVEQEFWKHVTQKQNHICVHSGSIDSGNWGYGFAVSKNSPFARHAWNLKVLTNNSGSVLRSLGPIMGVTVPTLHVGMVFSSCCWYRDPHGLPWIEYLHTGGNKIWYGIPDSTSASFHAALKRTVPNYCRNKTIWLPSDTVMVPPDLLVENGVSLSRVAQEPGQFVVVFPKVYTSCLSTGYVVSESVYFAPPAWLRSAKVLFDELRDSSEPSMFSLDRLLLSIVNDQRSNVEVLRQVTPAVRALCDMEKSNRDRLRAMGVGAEEKLPMPEAPTGKKKRKLHENDGDYECELCRMNLFVSMVTESQEDGVYCLDHAIEQIEKEKIQPKLCKLLYTYDVKDLDGLQDKIKTAIENKLHKKIPGKFAGMPTLLNK